MGILPTAKYAYSNYAFWNWESNLKMSLGTHWDLCETSVG